MAREAKKTLSLSDGAKIELHECGKLIGISIHEGLTDAGISKMTSARAEFLADELMRFSRIVRGAEYPHDRKKKKSKH